MEMKFYRCAHCGQIVAIVKNKGVPIMCCGEKMQEIVPGTTEAATEKHIPVYTVDGNKVFVTVGEVEHPMHGFLLKQSSAISARLCSQATHPKPAFQSVTATRLRLFMHTATFTPSGKHNHLIKHENRSPFCGRFLLSVYNIIDIFLHIWYNECAT